MDAKQLLRGALPMLLAVALVLSFGAVTASAEEAAPGEAPAESQPLPSEATPSLPAEPPMEEDPEGESTPAESTPAPSETPPAQTETPPAPSETPPTQTQTPPAPTETPPVQTETPPAPQTPLTISQAKGREPGAQVLVQGVIVCAHGDMTVLQDDTGGIRLTLPDGTAVRLGEKLRARGARSNTGIAVEELTSEGDGTLPLLESTLAEAPECQRILVKNGILTRSGVTQGGAPTPTVPSAPEGLDPGDRADFWGVKVGGSFYVEKAQPIAQEAPETLPAVTATPADRILLPGEEIGLFCGTDGAQIFYCTSADGVNFGEYLPYAGGIPAAQGTIYVRAYAQKEGFSPSSVMEFAFTREETEQSWENSEPSGEQSGGETGQLTHYFGLLHAHSVYSGGTGTPAEAFAQAKAQGLDFFAVTDRSNSFLANSVTGEDPSGNWTLGKEAASAATDGSFVAIYGYEIPWPERMGYGHINTFHTGDWISTQEVDSLAAYYDAMAALPGSISQFNHPCAAYGYFENFAHYSPKYDAAFQLLEVGDGAEEDNGYYYYTKALDMGWHVAPTNHSYHHEADWGLSGKARTGILAQGLSKESLYQAIRSRRVYATEDPDLEITYRLNGALMGSTIREEPRIITVNLRDPGESPEGTLVMVIGKGGTILKKVAADDTGEVSIPISGDSPYYYLRILQTDKDVAVTAPVWVDLTEDVGIQSFTASKDDPAQGETVTLALTLYNNEDAPFQVTSLECFLGGVSVHKEAAPGEVGALGTRAWEFPLSYSGLGAVTAETVVTGALRGKTVSLTQSLSLRYQSKETDIPLESISQVRTGIMGELYRVQGYVTAGTSNPNTTFPGMIYLQDETGGIAVDEFYEADIPVGALLEVTGYLEKQDRNPTLVLVDSRLLERSGQRVDPATISNAAATDYAVNGGKLVQVEGEVISMTRTADNWGVSRFTLKDAQGTVATVRIDSAITSLASGENRLITQVRAGRRVRARGILHLEADGTPVIRVRNCEEVVYVEPRADPSNPKTQSLGREQIYLAGAIAAFSLSSLIGLYLIKKLRDK